MTTIPTASSYPPGPLLRLGAASGHPTAPARPHLAGLGLIAGSLLIYLAGIAGAELFLTRVSLIGVVAGVVLFLFGTRHLRILAFPIAFLLLMVPLPAIVFNQVAFPLQLLASQMGEGVIAAAGVPVLRDGNVLHLPSRSLEVVGGVQRHPLADLAVDACDRSRLLHRAADRPRIAIALAAVPLAIVANATRVAGTGLAAEWISPAAADGFFHTFSGWLMFVVATAGLLLVQRGVARFHNWRAAAPVAEPA